MTCYLYGNVTSTDNGLNSYILWTILDCALLVIILCGNTLTISTILRSKRLSKVMSNQFVLSLASSDLFIGFTLPYHMAFYLSDAIGKDKETCILRFVLIALGCSASLCNLIIIAIDRYIAIVYPLHYCRLVTNRYVWQNHCIPLTVNIACFICCYMINWHLKNELVWHAKTLPISFIQNFSTISYDSLSNIKLKQQIPVYFVWQLVQSLINNSTKFFPKTQQCAAKMVSPFSLIILHTGNSTKKCSFWKTNFCTVTSIEDHTGTHTVNQNCARMLQKRLFKIRCKNQPQSTGCLQSHMLTTVLLYKLQHHYGARLFFVNILPKKVPFSWHSTSPAVGYTSHRVLQKHHITGTFLAFTLENL